jgi:hypothetical protein
VRSGYVGEKADLPNRSWCVIDLCAPDQNSEARKQGKPNRAKIGSAAVVEKQQPSSMAHLFEDMAAKTGKKEKKTQN